MINPDQETNLLSVANLDKMNELIHRVDTIRDSDWDNFFLSLSDRQKKRLMDAGINHDNNTHLRYNLLLWADGDNLRDPLRDEDKKFINEMTEKLPIKYGSNTKYVGIHYFEEAIRLWDELKKYG